MKLMRSTSDIAKVYAEMLKRPCVQVIEHYCKKNELSILGTLYSTLRGLWRYEVVLDKWPNFSGLVLRPLQLEPRRSLYREVYVYGESETLHKILQSKDILPWDECLTFRASPTYMESALHKVAMKHGGLILDSTGNYQYYLAEDAILDINVEMLIPEGFHIGPLKEKHLAYILNLNKQHQKEGDSNLASEETHKILINNAYTACIYEAGGKPLSWVLGHLSGAAIHAFTDPQYRGYHLFGLVSIFIEQQAHKFGQVHSHALAKTENKSVQSAVKTHFKALPQLVTSFDYIPPGWAKSKI